MSIVTEFREIITKNNKIISTRLNKEYFHKIGKDVVWNSFIQYTNKLSSTYQGVVDLLVAAEVSPDIQYCANCGNNPRKVTRDDNSTKKILSLYCCQKCASTSKEKIEKFKASVTVESKSIANKKRRATMLDKYGVEYNTQRPEIKKSMQSNLPKEKLRILQNKDQMVRWYVTENKSLTEIANNIGVFYGTVGDYLTKYGVTIRPSTNNSFEQTKIKQILDNLGIIYEENNTSILSPKHLDFYIPEYKLAIEWNGNYYHTEDYRGKDYHKNKYIRCKDKNIKLLQFYTQDLYDSQPIMESIIRYHVRKSSTIYARKCKIGEVSKDVAKQFQKQNHIQGYVSSEVNYGLFLNDGLVALMTFGKPRFNSSHQWELLRFCNKINCNVVGGASKLLSHFESTHKPTSILSYCSNDRSNGNLYDILGFSYVDSSESYFWNKSHNILSRYSTTKTNLKKILGDEFRETESQVENMHRCGWRRVYTAGNSTYIKVYNNT